MCDNCEDYTPVKPNRPEFSVIIIKLDALGDVLRTTAILPAVKRKYPAAHITWITRRNAIPVFDNLPTVNEVVAFEDTERLLAVGQFNFDVLIHPDASPESAPLATMIRAKEKFGFITDKAGKVFPANKEAEEWFEMGAFDQYKKANKKTYQQIIHEIARLPYQKDEIQIHLTPQEFEKRDKFVAGHDLAGAKYILGINVGASGRWQLKQWRMDGFFELIPQLYGVIPGLKILLYGGKDEASRINELTERFPALISTGTDNDLRSFFALMDIPGVVITGDTMALHAATALRKRVVCLFGPTSSNEIEDYGRIIKVIPKMDCLVCYKPTCDFDPNCMDLISTEMVLNAVLFAFDLGLA